MFVRNINVFGYIKPNKMELKLKEIKRYSSCYCALCDQLKKDYGFLSRFILNYDVTFLLVFLDNKYDNPKKHREFRCPYNLLRKIRVEINNDVIEYSAFINYWLVTEKLLDDYIDNHNIIKLLLYKLLTIKKKFKQQKSKYSAHIEKLTDKLHNVYLSEKEAYDTYSFDELINSFGDFFASLFNVALSEVEQKVDTNTYKILFNMGKWLYIIDAFDDYAKDSKKNNVNILNCLSDDGQLTSEEVFDKTLSLHYQIRYKIDLLLKDTIIKDECVLNALTYGINLVFADITRKKYKSCLRRLTNDSNKVVEQMDREN